MRPKAKFLVVPGVLLAMAMFQGCKHPLAIVGEGDIVDVNNSGHGCTLEQFRAKDKACTENEVSGDYFANYKAKPRPGWRFVRWDGSCPPDSNFQYCRLQVSKAAVAWWDKNYPYHQIPPSTAVFQPITGETGYLLAGTAVAGVAYETKSQQGITGLDGSFQYERGETVRFTIGDTVLGNVSGQAQVTPFDLAGSTVLTGTPNIKKALDKQRDPFHAVINITVLLQSLDHDANPENGIKIRQGVASLFRAVKLDVSEHWESFPKEYILRHIIGLANTMHRFSSPHGVFNPAPAMQSLYDTLGIDARTFAVTLEHSRLYAYVTSYEYDANGYLVRVEPESPGNMPELWRWRYDANGHLLWSEGYYRSGPITEDWQYDTYGNVTRHQKDWESDGTINQIITTQYNADGNVTRTEDDTNGDGIPEEIETRQYDAYGNETRRQRESLIVTWHYWHDATGKLIREEHDDFADGTVDSVMTYQYDTDGNLTRVEYRGGTRLYFAGRETDIWPVVDAYDYNTRLATYEYDAGGNVTRKLYDLQRDAGSARHTVTEKYDSSGNLVQTMHRIEEDYNADGILESIYTDIWVYEQEDGSSVRRWEGDYGANGTLDRVVIYNVDAQGHTTREQVIEGDGVPEDITTFLYLYKFDTDGNLVHSAADENGDGRLDTFENYEYGITGWGHIFANRWE